MAVELDRISDLLKVPFCPQVKRERERERETESGEKKIIKFTQLKEQVSNFIHMVIWEIQHSLQTFIVERVYLV